MASAYTYRSFIESDRAPTRGSRLGWMNDSMVSGPSRAEGPDVWQATGSTDISYSNFHQSPQSCSMYSSQRDDIPPVQPTTVLSASENANGSADKKPALPPKPQGPPSYREPPVPPLHEETNQHPDICINSAPPPRPEPKPHSSEAPPVIERPDRLGSRTHAWVQEHKTSGKLVGEKLSSLQRKLRSLLTQSSTKGHTEDFGYSIASEVLSILAVTAGSVFSVMESTDIEKGVSIEEKPAAEGHDAWNYHSSTEISHRPKSTYSSYNMPSTSSQDQRLSYMSSSFGSGAASLSSLHPSTHNHPSKTSFLHERHPFGAPANLSEQEDAADAEQLRDACNKFFSRDQRISWTNYLSPRNCYSNNIKSSYDYDKLVPKEVIGRPSQEKKVEVTANCEAIYGGVTPFPSYSKSHEIPVKQTDSQPPLEYEGSYFARRVQNLEDESNVQDSQSAENKVPNKESEAPPQETLPCGGTDYSDLNDFYKSSSESGRGTMHSSMHGSKSVVSPHSSGVSAASNLDTSLDSDHSASGTLWDQKTHNTEEKRLTEDYQGSQVRHIYETPNTAINCRQAAEKDDVQDDVTSESLSVTPPLPPLSPAPSPPLSAENSPKLSSRAKYKLSLSASALNSSYSKPNDHQQKVCEMPSSKSGQGKKPGVRRTTSINQATCRHRTGKTYQCSKGPATSGHRLGISHGNCTTSKKCSSSPPSRHHSRTQLAYPCYLDNGDPELTSTTTGLDMESLLDDADDYSSDLSATASTMEPSEVNMIRKQLEGLEAMYSEILRVLGVKNSCKDNAFGGSAFDISRHSRRRVNDSLSSLTARSSASRGTHNFADKRGFSEKRRSKSDCRLSSAGKRLQRLESHVVTLARSVAHLSSEMRTQHVLVQELENMRQDVSWVQERMRLMQLAQGCHSGNGSRNHQLAMPRDWDNFHREVLELLNPCRAKKLTKFFGDEPPLIRQFLKRLGYEKYATNFENEKIGIKELPYLTEERLQKMGIPMGPRIRILQEAHACCQQNQYKVYIV